MTKVQCSSLPCVFPFYRFIVACNHIAPCCELTFSQDTEYIADEKSMLEAFNSEKIVTLRKQLSEGTFSEYCKQCMQSGHHMPESGVVDARIFANLEQYQQEGDLAALVPCDYIVRTPSNCNLRCTFCEQTYARPGKELIDQNTAFLNKHYAILQSVGWDRIMSVNFSGGEPFFNKAVLEQVDKLNANEHSQTTFSVTTNGTLLHKHFDMLARIPRLEMNVSIDALGSRYEHIRQGARWEKTLQNLRQLSQLAKVKSEWNVSLHSVLSRTSLPDLLNVMKLAQELDFGFSVYAVGGYFPEENIFTFPSLTAGVDWQSILDETIAFAEQHYPQEVGQLTGAKEQLIGLHAGEKPRNNGFCPSSNEIEAYTAFFESMSHKRFALLGMNHGLAGFILASDYLPGLVALSSPSFSESTFLGQKFVAPEELAKEADHVVLVCKTYEYEQYRTLVEEKFSDDQISILPGWSKQEQANVEQIAQNKEPIVAFCTGGFSQMVLQHGPLREANIVAFSDNNPDRQGKEFLGKPVVSPENILNYATQVVVLSEAFCKEISEQLVQRFGDTVTILPFFEKAKG